MDNTSCSTLDKSTLATNDECLKTIQEYKDHITNLERDNEHTLANCLREKVQLQETIEKKNQMIDLMRFKLNRYEFAVKEAVLFLAKPMETYDMWLTGKEAQIPPENENCDASKRNRTQSALPVTKKPSIERMRESSVPTPAQMAQKQQHQQQSQNLHSDTPQQSSLPAHIILLDEMTVMECVRLSLNYLKNAQIFVKSLEPGEKVTNEDLKLAGQIPLMDKSVQTELIANYGSSQSSPTLQLLTPSDVIMDSRLKRQTKIAIQKKIATQALERIPDEGEEGDIASNPPPNHSSNQQTKEKCELCRNFMLQLDHQRDLYEAVNRESDCLQTFLTEEKASKERLQHSKDILDTELEELTAQLFDQANKMVIEEARLRDGLEISNRDLKQGMNEMSFKIQQREEELILLRKHILGLEKTRTMSKSGSPYASIANISKDIKRVNVDGILFQEFQDFLQKIQAQQFLSVPFLQSIQFVKRCIIEDIEPCLFYTYNFTGSTLKTPILSSSLKKRILEGVLNLQCEFQKQDISVKQFKQRCSICLTVRDCAFECSLSTTGKQVWSECCRFCQTRLSVCQDMFKFINFFKSTKQQSTLLGLFRQISMFRGAMVLARQGSYGLFDLETVHAAFIGTDWEKNVSILN